MFCLFTDRYNTWEPQENILDPRLIETFEDRYKEADLAALQSFYSSSRPPIFYPAHIRQSLYRSLSMSKLVKQTNCPSTHPSVRPSVHPSVRPSVHLSKPFIQVHSYFVY